MNQSSSYSPQPLGPLCLVDVDKVGHHAALEQTALSLHPDLEQHEDTRTHTPTCEVDRFDLSHLFIPQKDQTHREVIRLTLRTSVGLAKQEDMTPETTPQNTLMTIVSSVQTTAADQHRFPQTDQVWDNQIIRFHVCCLIWIYILD